MKYSEFRKASTAVLLVATTVGMAGCSNDDGVKAGKSDINFSETEASKIDKGMENQPESSYWFPEELLAWDADKDLDAKYNISHTPLATRVAKESLPKANGTQNEEMKVVALSIMNSSTSGNAPHGSNTFDANVFSNWQYIDQLVYWGGSSGEGIIVPPSADVVDAAHKNGVPVLGTIFFPQTAHGGQIEWLDTFLEKDSEGHFPMVDKLIEVANVYGFDGWFINQETDTEVTSFDDVKEGKESDKEGATEGGLSKEHADLMQELMAEYKKTAGDDLELMWYDSMTSEGEMDWQNALTDKNQAYMVDAEMNPLADSMFLNFWWNTDKYAKDELLKASEKKAEELQINPYDLYAGIDVQENGYSTPVKWDLFTDGEGKAYTSLGLYVPSWTHDTAGDPDDFQTRENIFWVNSKMDATQGELPKDNEWPGISTFAVEQTAITSLPFKTNFNLGNGYNYFIDGDKVSSMNWNNRSMQDVMPTYRWNFEHGKDNRLDVTMDYADAYNGGNSLKLRGNMTDGETSRMKLYGLEARLEKDILFTTTAKASEETELNLVLGFEDETTEVFKGDKKVDDEWTTITYDTKKAEGKVITSISYDIEAEEGSDTYELRLGQLAAQPKAEKVNMSVTGLTIEDAIFDEEESNFAGVRLFWDEDKSDAVSYYEIYRVNGDKTRSFLGATPAANHYINALERNDETNKTVFEVVPVDNFGNRGKASESVTMEWPDNSVPKADFNASRTLIAPGDKVTFTNNSSTNTESVKWEFEGGDIETSTDDNPVVAFEKAGTYTVKMTAINKAGETPIERTSLITVDDKAKGDLDLVSKGVDTEASSFVNDGEAPEFAVDGKLDTKWCATGTPPHSITLDLGEAKTISEVHLDHAEAGGEGPDMNTRAYTIEVSEDGKEFEKVTRVINNEGATSVDTFSATSARYVRLTIDKPTQGADSAARIYGVSVYGLK